MSTAMLWQGALQLRQLLLNDTPLIDTRSPGEFAKGSLPTSVSLPLMTDAERARVGTCYKRQGQAAAIELGHQLVSGDTKSQRVAAWVAFARRHPNGALYCWRGGLRSQICQQWMAEAGCEYPRVVGGYKALRRLLIDEQARICQQQPLLLLGGRTGCDKTGLIRQLPLTVDLEGLANHLGSSFGRRPGGQPSQLQFENALAVALMKAEQSARPKGAPVLLEDEGRLVGRCALPPDLSRAMARSPLVLLELSLAQRVEHSYHNYILGKLAAWQTHLGMEQGFEAFAEDLTQSLYRVRKRLGGVRYDGISKQLHQALQCHQQGDAEAHRGWIEALLVDYYDPMYDYQLSKRQHLIRFRGDREQVLDYLATAGIHGS